jgi:hypothetical protein
MKKQFLIIFFLFFVYCAQSQVLIALLLGDKLNTGNIEFGLDGGINYSSISGMDTNNSINSFNLGFYFDIRIKDQWFLNTGVLVKSNYGVDELTTTDLNFLGATIHDIEGGTYKQKLNTFVVPILAKYKFKNHMHVEAGPQIGWIHKAWVEFNYDEDGLKGRIKEDNKDLINWFDMGVTGGVGYRFLDGLGWTVGVRYYYGFTNVYKNRSGTTNNSLFLKLNIPFGVSDDTKKKIEEKKAIILEEKLEKKEAKKKAKENKN